MKFVCIECDEPMKFGAAGDGTETVSGRIVTLQYRCANQSFDQAAHILCLPGSIALINVFGGVVRGAPERAGIV